MWAGFAAGPIAPKTRLAIPACMSRTSVVTTPAASPPSSATALISCACTTPPYEQTAPRTCTAASIFAPTRGHSTNFRRFGWAEPMGAVYVVPSTGFAIRLPDGVQRARRRGAGIHHDEHAGWDDDDHLYGAHTAASADRPTPPDGRPGSGGEQGRQHAAAHRQPGIFATNPERRSVDQPGQAGLPQVAVLPADGIDAACYGLP